MKRAVWGIGALAVVAAVVLGLTQAKHNSDNGNGPISVKSDYNPAKASQALAGSPPLLASLHQQAGQILAEGDFKARLKTLKGTPVVVNKWASWCDPCRFEFPSFQRLSVSLGKQIAFVGLNSGDNSDDAKGFLTKFPVPYPSYEDPKSKLAQDLKATVGFPVTIFIDRDGKVAYSHPGRYHDDGALRADIKRYLGV